MVPFVMASWELTWAGRSISTAKQAKALDVPKAIAPVMTDARILVAQAFLGLSARGSQPFASFAVGIPRVTMTARRIARERDDAAAAVLPTYESSATPTRARTARQSKMPVAAGTPSFTAVYARTWGPRSPHTTTRAPKTRLVIA
jgi:hypothetical protein